MNNKANTLKTLSATTFLFATLLTFIGPVKPVQADIGVPDQVPPWLVSIGVGSPGHVCTGTLVAPGKVLTAAHCLADFEHTTGKKVVFVRKNVPVYVAFDARVPAAGQGVRVQAVSWATGAQVPHKTKGWDFADLAVITLPQSTATDPARQPLPLNPDTQPQAGTTAEYYGYGGGLRSKPLPVQPTKKCGNDPRMADSVCAGSFNDDFPPCAGDSGGPLVQDNHLVGVFSGYSTISCGSSPGIWTSVSTKKARAFLQAVDLLK